MNRVILGAIVRVDLPDHTAYLTDGGYVVVSSQAYSSEDSVLGVVDAFQSFSEGVGDEAPAGVLSFLPPDGVASADLIDPTIQGSRVRVSIVDIDPDTGEPTDTPEQMADWIVDNPELTFAEDGRRLDFNCVANAERLFQTNQGNCLSPTFHQRIWPGETGLRNASGVSTTVAWATNAPPRGTRSGGIPVSALVEGIMGRVQQ
ncbi:MAG: hypothetical protein EOP58_11765 [Sphingomonadales bacterium]|nr:MAG: hypothetical protein EOP58_11765 [Sphingomonadales bacterium]